MSRTSTEHHGSCGGFQRVPARRMSRRGLMQFGGASLLSSGLMKVLAGRIAAATRKGRIKSWLLLFPTGKNDQIFNLTADLGEQNYVVAKPPEKVAELQALMKQLRGQGRSRPCFLAENHSPNADGRRPFLSIEKAGKGITAFGQGLTNIGRTDRRTR